MSDSHRATAGIAPENVAQAIRGEVTGFRDRPLSGTAPSNGDGKSV
jgi:hypothetical protein